MKKNKLNLLLTGLLSLMVVGCTSETEDVLGNESGDTKTITIQLPKLKVVENSYATASLPENTLKNLQIVELQNSVVRKVHTATINTGDVTATFTVTGSGSRDFYLAANATASTLTGISTGSSLADVLATVTTASTSQITTANGLLMDAKIINHPLTTPTASATMKRRVARFDVVNKKAETNFTVASVLIAKAKTQAYVFTPTTELTDPNANLSELNLDNTGAIDSIPAAFYLNPTEMGTGAKQTEITFKDTNDNLYKVAVANGKKIEANKRYVIRLSKSSDGTVVGSIDVNDKWDDEDLITEEFASTLSNPTMVTANGATVNAKAIDMSASTGSATFKFTTTSASSTPVLVTPSDKVKIDVQSTTPALSYGATWSQTHTVIASESLSGNHTITVEDGKGLVGTITIAAGSRFVNPLKAFAKANLSADYKIGTDLTPATAGLTTSYGGWFQWGRKAGFANPSKGTPTAPVAFDKSIMTESTGAFYGGANMYTWHTEAGGLKDTWTNLVSQGSGDVLEADPCRAAGNYRVPTVDEWLAVIPHNSNAGNYTSTHADKTVAGDTERTGNQITAKTGPAKYIASGAGKVLYAVKKMGKDDAYALRWSYVGTGVAFANQDSVYVSGTTPAGDTYLEIVCIPAAKDFDPADAQAFADLDWTKDAEVRYFPAAGRRFYNSGDSEVRGANGRYWSSSCCSMTGAWYSYLGDAHSFLDVYSRSLGGSLRCVAQ